AARNCRKRPALAEQRLAPGEGWRRPRTNTGPPARPARYAPCVVAIRVAEPRFQQAFFPPDNRVVLGSQQHDDEGSQPGETRGQGEAGPQRQIPDVERITNHAERTAVDQRAKAAASGARDGSDVANRPEPQQFAS